MLSGWAVEFTYLVDGKTYEGILVSKDQVEKHNQFAIRYNPSLPDENDSQATKIDWCDGMVMGVYDAFLVLILVSLIIAGFFMKS